MKIDKHSRELLKYISEDFVMLTGTTVAAYHVATGDLLGEKGFRHYCAKHYGDVVMTDDDGKEQRAAAGEIWWNWNDPDRRVVRRIVMEPTSKPEKDDNPEAYNRWHVLKHTMAEPELKATPDDIGIFIRHLMFLADNDSVGVMYFLCWLAQLYQTPEIKIPTAILLFSKVGRIGKNLTQRLISKVFGPPLVASCTGKLLKGTFMDGIEHKRIVFINEMSHTDRSDSYEEFKSLISETMAQFEGKGRPSKEITNIAHYIITSNHDNALPLMEKDGRIAVLKCSGQRLTDEYYRELVAWIDGPGPALMAGVLANWKFPKDWDPYAPVPQTEAALSMQRQARGELAMSIEDMVNERRPPFDKDIGRPFDLILQFDTLYGVKLNYRTLPKALESIGAVQLPMVNWLDKDKKPRCARIWVWRDREKYENMKGKDIADILGIQ